MATDQVTLTAHCLCKANVFTASVPKSSLPLKAYACHCNSCRHVTGALYSIDTPWPAPPESVDISRLKTYDFSSKICVHFCGTCSTPIFFGHPGAEPPNGELGVFTGALKNEPAGEVVKICNNIFVGDTVDGGITPWLRKPNADGSEAKCWKGRAAPEEKSPQELPAPWPAFSNLTGYEKRIQDSVSIRCKCGGVDFVLHRGKYDGKSDDKLPWFVDRKTHKYIADHCVCDSCRLFSGIDIFSWTFSELGNISFAANATHDAFPKTTGELKALVDAQDPAIGTLKYYASSPDVQRYFCSVCSACVFYALDERDWMVDVAVGVLDALDGARGEGFLAWRFDKMDFISDTKCGWREAMVERALEAGKKWSEEREYPKV